MLSMYCIKYQDKSTTEYMTEYIWHELPIFDTSIFFMINAFRKTAFKTMGMCLKRKLILCGFKVSLKFKVFWKSVFETKC